MSDNSITLVDLAVPSPEAPERAAVIRGWLLGHGIAEVNSRRDDLMHPSEFAAGPQYRRAADDPDGWLLHRANTGIDLQIERMVHHPMGNYTPPDCPQCGSQADEASHSALCEVWLFGTEPSLQCAACRVETPLGDWIGKWTFQVASLGVCFNNWTLRDEFIAELSPIVGDRVRVVRAHY